MTIAIIGAGASGMFCAVNLSREHQIDVFEASKYPLRKVIASGGGRCNFTNENIDTADLSVFYPRGAGSLKKPMRRFGCKQTREFFANLKVASKTEDNGRVFPTCDDSRAIAYALQNTATANGVKIITNAKVDSISKNDDGKFEVKSGALVSAYDVVVVAVGGLTDESLKENFQNLGIKIEPTCPSLFALELDSAKNATWQDMSGISIDDVELLAQFDDLKKADRKILSHGAMLISHFGIGGPAVLKFSSFGAKAFNFKNYNFNFTINFAPRFNEELRKKTIIQAREKFAKKYIANAPLFDLPQKLWSHLLELSNIPSNTLFASLNKQSEQTLFKNIFSFQAHCTGRSTHKGEFVTCGGIAREEVDFSTMRCKKIDNLFFVGECIDIDAITGGFNLQSAWTTAKVCAEALNLSTNISSR